jgi:hypothetical protein
MTTNLLTTIQRIVVNVVNSMVPTEYCYGTVTSQNPLSIRLNEGTIEISGESIVLTEPVIEKLLTINKHTHCVGETLGLHVHPIPAGGSTSAPTGMSQLTEIDDTVVSAKCTEDSVDLPTSSDTEKIVVTLNRGLEKGDKVVMLRVSSGQKFIVLSRIFEREGD